MCATALALNISLPNGTCANRDCQAAVRAQSWLDQDGDRNALRRLSGAPSDLGGHPMQSGETQSHAGAAIASRAGAGFSRRLGLGEVERSR
jgi:hypothetical protein